jgi:hypothetical protein
LTIKGELGINALLGLIAESGIAGALGVSTADTSLAGDAFIYYTGQDAATQGFNNWDKVDALTYGGSAATNTDVSQATSANQPYYREVKTYTASGFDSVGADEVALTGEGALTEDAATNLSINSSAYEGAGWNRNGVTVVDGDSVGLGLSFSKITQNSSSGKHEVASTGFASTTDFSFQILVKRDTARYVYMDCFKSTTNRTTQVFDLVDGTVTDEDTVGISSPSAVIKNIIDDYYLLQVYGTSASGTFIASWGHAGSATPSYDAAGVPTFLGDGVTYFSCAWAQPEQSQTPSSLIYTSGSSALRSADDFRMNTCEAAIDESPGITGSTGAISLIGTKYEGLGTASFIGARFYNTDGTQSSITAGSANSITVDADVNAGAALDFTRSAYTTNAALVTLRNNAGDAGPFVEIDNNLCVFEMDVTFNKTPTNAVYLFLNPNLGSRYEYNLQYQTSTSKFRFRYFGAGSDRTIDSTVVTPSAGKRYTFRITTDNVTATEALMEIFGEDGYTFTGSNAANPDLFIASYLHIGRQSGGNIADITIHRLTVKDLTGSTILEIK